MATPSYAAPGPTRRAGRRALVALTAVAGVLFCSVPAQATPGAPTTTTEAVEAVAARGHELEVLTEEFNLARETLSAQTKAAEAAVRAMEQATAGLASAQEGVRGIARSAYTGEAGGSFRAMMVSQSAAEFVDRVSTLQMIADHQNGILGRAAEANVAAAAAHAAARESAAEAQKQYDAVMARKADLEAQIAEYQAIRDRLSAEERQAVAVSAEGRASRAERAEAPAADGPVVASSQAAQIAVDTAMAQRGKPYVWAAAGPGSFDCSGLLQYAFAAAGIQLPHSSRMQAQMGRSVSRDELRPGDIVAFYSPVSHIGIYIGNGQMVAAPSSGDVVKVQSIDRMGSAGITAMRRIAG